MPTRDSTKFRIGFTILGIILGLGFFHFRTFIYVTGFVEISMKLRVIEVVGWAGILSLTALIIYAWIWGIERIIRVINASMRVLVKFRWLSLPGAIFLFILFPFQVVGENGVYYENLYTRISVYLLLGLICGTLLKVWWQQSKWIEMFIVSLLILATTYNAASYAPLVSSYPLSMGWSETSRYYYASTFFAEGLTTISPDTLCSLRHFCFPICLWGPTAFGSRY
jgi:hypothetical protein